MNKKKILSTCVVLFGMAIVFSATRLKPKASSLNVGKDGLELVKPGTDTSGGTSSDSSSSNSNKTEGKLEYEKGTISHVCYLYIDKNGNIIYDSKDDSAGNKTCVKLPYKKDYILVVFIKQAQSGMIWCEKELSDKEVEKVLAVIKKNDKSYKGHDAVAFGKGEHKLTYSNGSCKKITVKYRFDCGASNNTSLDKDKNDKNDSCGSSDKDKNDKDKNNSCNTPNKNDKDNKVDKNKNDKNNSCGSSDKNDKDKNNKVDKNDKGKNNSCGSSDKNDKDKNNKVDKNDKDKNHNTSNKNDKDKNNNTSGGGGSNGGSSGSVGKDGLDLVKPGS